MHMQSPSNDFTNTPADFDLPAWCRKSAHLFDTVTRSVGPATGAMNGLADSLKDLSKE